jgi:hypothetical protein
MQKGIVIIIGTKENADPSGEDGESHTKIHDDYVRVEFSKSTKDDHVTSILQQSSLIPHKLCPLSIHGLPRVRSRPICLSHFADMRVKWK